LILAGGLCACYQIAANAAFVSATPPDKRSQAFGLAQGGISLGQGTVMLVAGAAAQTVSPAQVIAFCGCIGVVIAAVLSVGWSGSQSGLRLRDRKTASAPADGAHGT
jgi:Major Facilitator Superfamily